MSEVGVLAGIVRAGLDAVEEWAPLLPDRAAIQDALVAGALSVNHARALQTIAARARVLARVGEMRGLLDAILAWPHHATDDDVERCAAADWRTGQRSNDAECTCGRDARALRLLRHLAAAYQTTQEGQ